MCPKILVFFANKTTGYANITQKRLNPGYGELVARYAHFDEKFDQFVLVIFERKTACVFFLQTHRYHLNNSYGLLFSEEIDIQIDCSNIRLSSKKVSKYYTQEEFC